MDYGGSKENCRPPASGFCGTLGGRKAFCENFAPEQGTGTDIRLAFGKMPLVKAVREQMVSKEGSTWTGKGRLEDGTPSRSQTARKENNVVLKDRIPLSAQEKITVETMRIEPRPDEQDKENILTWKIPLAPGEKKKGEVLFRIGYPADETVVFR
jgi:hypothetical protein